MNANPSTNPSPPAPVENEVIRRLRQDIAGGKHWYIALLEAIGRWQTDEEEIDGRRYRYLIGGEAFDWLLLAEKLCRAVDSLLPEDEKTALLFHGKPPIELGANKFKELIGDTRYKQYLNYFYGITAEEALLQAVEEEIRKERRALGRSSGQDITDKAYHRIYGSGQQELLNDFRKQKGYPRRRSISLTELKEFTYWLFNYRLLHCDKARVASDTRKALKWLNNNAVSAPDRNI